MVVQLRKQVIPQFCTHVGVPGGAITSHNLLGHMMDV